MSRNRALWIALLVLGCAALACIGSIGAGTVPVGEKAPAFGIRKDGRTVTLDDLLGDVVVINFWSST